MTESFGTYPSGRNIIDKTHWKNRLKQQLEMEHLWCEAKIGNETSSQVENDYYRGYMQCLDRVLKGNQPTEIKRIFENWRRN